MSNTPRSDAAEFYYDGPTGFVGIEFARNLEIELAAARADVVAAAGELRIPIPEPGSQTSQLLVANRIMKDEVALLRNALYSVRAEMDHQAKRANDWQWCCDLFCDFCSSQPMPPDSSLDKAMAMRADLKAKERGV